MIIILDKFDENIFSQIIKIWKITGVGNPERGDNLVNINKTLTSGGKILTLYSDNTLIGTCWITHDFRRCYIHHMAIHPDFQNMGHGKLLLEKALEYCQDLGLQAKLEVHNHNPHAQQLYKNFGFKLLDGYEVYIKRDIK
jgi:ribosomal protein S18 acetylase RimI-like enzyme